VTLRASALTREAIAATSSAAGLSALLVWIGPPGSDFAAHLYQRAVFLQHGFALWNNFWYAGRYSFVTYSLIYYPLAGVLGIRLLAVATVATAALAFAVVVMRQWGAEARWSSRTFGIVWAGVVLSAAFPFALGAALALLAIWAIQGQRLWRFAAFALLTLAASPVAFILLTIVLAGIGIGRRTDRRTLFAVGFAIVSLGLTELCLWRIFPSDGRYPFSGWELAAALVFCAFGIVITWNAERARIIRFFFPVYAAACIASFVVPSAIGDNVVRVRYVAVPVSVLVLALRDWRPRILTVVALALAVSWNVSPLADSYAKSSSDPAAHYSFWQPAIAYLHEHLTPSDRVEAIDTVGHWEAFYLARAGIPLARGWFRQDDFPQNALLYGHLGPRAYLRWLRGLGVRYVVLPNAPPDYSAEAEAVLVRSGRVPLDLVFVGGSVTIYRVPFSRPIVTGPASAPVISLSEDGLALLVGTRGVYRIAIRYSPYWHASVGCVFAGPDKMLRLRATWPGPVRLSFRVDAGRALNEVAGGKPDRCA
jgi:hypothetical protein